MDIPTAFRNKPNMIAIGVLGAAALATTVNKTMSIQAWLVLLRHQAQSLRLAVVKVIISSSRTWLFTSGKGLADTLPDIHADVRLYIIMSFTATFVCYSKCG